MKKLILSLFCLSTIISVQAQLQADNRTISFGTNKQQNVINKALTSCNNDTLDYTTAKATGLETINLNNASSAQAISQYYNAPQAITVHGATFYAYKLNATGGTSLNATVSLYLAGIDSMPTGAPLATGTVLVDTTFGTGALPILEKNITFASPVTVTQPYVIVVGNYSANGMGVVCNSWTAADGSQEWLTGIDLFGTWTRPYNVTIGPTIFDADALILPHVSYDLNADFSANPLYFNTAPTNVTFTDNSSPVLQDRMYNQAAFIASTQLSYTYDFGDGNPTVNAINTNNNYTLVQPFTVTLNDTLFGWRTNCNSSESLILNASADLIITEIMYNPAESGVDSSEFIEIYNNGTNAVNLNNFTCTGGIYTFPNVNLAAGAFYVITIDSSGFYNTYGLNANGVFSNGLSNGGESIVIKNPAGTVIDSVRYYTSGLWPSGSAAGQPNGGGSSLILCNVNNDNNIGSNWAPCTNSIGVIINSFPVLASPGQANNCAVLCANPDVPTVTHNPTTICDGSTTTLTISGNLNDASKWYIYTGSCGGTLIDSTATSTYVVTPTGPSTTYFIRGEGNCITPGSCGQVVVNVLPALTGSVTTTICNEDTLLVNGTPYYAGNPSGTEVFTNVGPSNCDSTVTVNLTVLAAKTGSVTNTICNNGSVLVNGTTYNAGNPSGTEIFTNVGPNMCDSTVTINLTVLAAKTGSISTTICNGDSIIVNGTTYNASNLTGTEVFTNVGPNMCDSTVTINLTLTTVDVSVTISSPMFTANATSATYQWVDCNNSYAAISGETNASFTATANGNYAVIVTQNGCTDTSVCFTVTGVGVNENNSLTGVNVFPNPANNVINVNLGNITTAVNFTLTSIDGKVVYQINNINDTKTAIDISNNAKGVYFLKIETNNQQNIYKVIKQ